MNIAKQFWTSAKRYWWVIAPFAICIVPIFSKAYGTPEYLESVDILHVGMSSVPFKQCYDPKFKDLYERNPSRIILFEPHQWVVRKNISHLDRGVVLAYPERNRYVAFSRERDGSYSFCGPGIETIFIPSLESHTVFLNYSLLSGKNIEVKLATTVQDLQLLEVLAREFPYRPLNNAEPNMYGERYSDDHEPGSWVMNYASGLNFDLDAVVKAAAARARKEPYASDTFVLNAVEQALKTKIDNQGLPLSVDAEIVD